MVTFLIMEGISLLCLLFVTEDLRRLDLSKKVHPVTEEMQDYK